MNLNYDESNRFLGMLAEVAAQTLNYEEKTLFKNLNDDKQHKKLNKNVLNVQQIRKLSDKVLVDSFSEFTCDEIRRVYSFKCCLVPPNCEVIFESYAAEDRARNLMRDHLLKHIQSVDSSFTAETVSAKNRRLNETNKNCRKSFQNKSCSKFNDKKQLNNSSTLSCVKKSKCLQILDSQRNDLSTTQTLCNINQLDSVICNETFDDHAINSDQYNNCTIIAKDVSLDLVSNQLQKNMDKNEKMTFITSRNSFEDHCYTSLEGPALESNTTKTISESVIINKKRSPNMSKVIATPAFPFIYEPVLPNISQVVEIGSSVGLTQTSTTKTNSNQFEIESKTNRTNNESPTNDTTNTSQLKRLALQYINDIRIKNRGQTDKNSFTCKICIDKTFTSPTTLIYHYRSHAGVKPYECSLCKATFTRQHSLNYHMLIHLNKSRFVCEECGRNFRHPSHFKEHMRRHTGETPYECNECFIKFKTRNTYKRHLQTKHAKILTSKGIFDLPDSSLHLRKPCPPRRKYGLGFLHQNIEAVARYERAQQQVNQTIKDNHDLNHPIERNNSKNFSSNKDNFEKLLQAVAIAEDDERSIVK